MFSNTTKHLYNNQYLLVQVDEGLNLLNSHLVSNLSNSHGAVHRTNDIKRVALGYGPLQYSKKGTMLVTPTHFI